MRPTPVPLDVQRPTRADNSRRIAKRPGPPQLHGSGNASLGFRHDMGVRLHTASVVVGKALYANVPKQEREHVKHVTADVEKDATAARSVKAEVAYTFPREGVAVFNRKRPDVAEHPACKAGFGHSHTQSLSAYKPDGKFGPPFHRGRLKLTCTLDGQRGRLFNQHRNTSLQKPSCNHCIEIVRQSHDGSVDTSAQRCEVRLGDAGWEITLQELGPVQLPIDHHHRREALEPSKCPTVKPLCYCAAANDGKSDWELHFTQPTLKPSGRSLCVS